VHPSTVEKQEVLVVLTLNLARFTDWPERVFNKKSPVFNLCVIGDNVVQEAFASIDKKIVKGKIVRIINIARLRNLAQCQLLYVSDLERNKLIQVFLELKNQPVLTIGENIEFLETGGMVALEKNSGKITLNINLPVIRQSGLVVSSRILKLAKIIDFSSLVKE
jgi:hypothetical protein